MSTAAPARLNGTSSIAAAPTLGGAAPTAINLLPQAIRLRAVLRRRSRAWMLTLGITAAATLAAWQWSWQVKRDGAAQRKSLLTQQVRLREAQRSVAAAQLRHDALERQQRALLALRARDSCTALLLAIADALPDAAALRRVQWSAAPSPGLQRPPAGATAPTESVIRIEGYAASYDVVTRFLTRLRGADLFREVRLSGSGEELIGNARVNSFVLVGRR